MGPLLGSIVSLSSTTVRVGTLTPVRRILFAQREELEREIGVLKAETEKIADETRELVGEMPF